MEFVCPICDTRGNLSEDKLTSPATKASCRQCNTILLINPETGKVEAHKSPLRGTREFALSHTQTPEEAAPVLELGRTQKDSRDWTAIITVGVVLVVLISAGIYFAGRLDIL